MSFAAAGAQVASALPAAPASWRGLGDRLGRLKLSADGLEARDRRVFDWCFARRIPLAFVMAGGYGVKIEETVQVQLTTYRVALAYRSRWQALKA